MNHEREGHYKSAFGSEDNLVANLIYLRDHELIDCHLEQVMSGSYIVMLDNTKITNKGIDFIRDDGGLSAILNVQTIKFHREAIVVLEDLIAMSNMNDEQKEKAKSTLGELSTEALKTVVQTATTAGLSVLFGK
ncbi:hypothetical protein GJJ25_19740 [Klebsiella pneumoniae]|nr:hypothetical protein [Klebsiella pneumoniae]QZY09591.1 hypothetical protein K6T93_14315 [Klebsiella pneumoniae subsp. pneumoniae]EKU3950623.1 hypothetical protein [Klebsiella pneumoniae]EKU8650353.1 hypothetical protein [Klebsiella pneumoniae]EKU8659497.1 hypothetical protein [Klebsiella pneumoniae]